MTEQGKESFCEGLNRYLMERFQYKREPAYISHLGGQVAAKRKLFDLYFRWLPSDQDWGGDTLVIARIYFRETRVGHGTSLLRFLCEGGCLYHYSQIGIEQANDNSAAFAQVYCFKRIEGTSNWVLPLSDYKHDLTATK